MLQAHFCNVQDAKSAPLSSAITIKSISRTMIARTPMKRMKRMKSRSGLRNCQIHARSLCVSFFFSFFPTCSQIWPSRLHLHVTESLLPASSFYRSKPPASSCCAQRPGAPAASGLTLNITSRPACRTCVAAPTTPATCASAAHSPSSPASVPTREGSRPTGEPLSSVVTFHVFCYENLPYVFHITRSGRPRSTDIWARKTGPQLA